MPSSIMFKIPGIVARDITSLSPYFLMVSVPSCPRIPDILQKFIIIFGALYYLVFAPFAVVAPLFPYIRPS